MPKKTRLVVTNYAKKRRDREYKERSRQKNVKNLTDEVMLERKIQKQDSRDRLKKKDPEGYRISNNHTQRLYLARKKARLTNKTTELLRSCSEEFLKKSHVIFTKIENGVRFVKYVDEDGLSFNSKILPFHKGTSACLQHIEPFLSDRKLELDIYETVFKSDRFQGNFEDIMQILNQSHTPGCIVDTYLELVLSNDIGFIPISSYTHFVDNEISAAMDVTLLKRRLLSKDMIIVPSDVIQGRIAHCYVSIIQPKLNIVDIYDSFTSYTTRRNKEDHINVILDELYKEAKVEREVYQIKLKKAPQQFDSTSCSFYMLYYLSCILEGKKIPGLVLAKDLEAIRCVVLCKLLQTTEIGKKVLELLII